ncbi:2-C-methyl-D-erythritol 4-phosphate cytidylyltransferase [Acidihalobacter ferrooxydans]|uniref:2-C-methyl-D-erythritol 4-phosphate cytidylyltransferase n=1 Tax=Acidihalobacter ferrooxydans TaxID=1765967 RepID=A0A1P8UHJ8_9GAMM|nr:2-C-methyl-D-erythritol 4-phosphate cytidylyltransferase [Acidihalobacter ferrooxydans]APZ43300.1 2-C-methyl-D-erythritol 4-phosphate cytidylyltransferase [Acidihalobacter ferrooxydans]
MSTPVFWIVIPAAGVGSRMGADKPKQYLELAGRTVIERTLDCFLGHPRIAGIVVAISADDPFWPVLECAADPRIVRAPGGRERVDSVRSALDLLLPSAAPADWVLVHDAARPLLAGDDLQRLIDALQDDPVGGILATPARDTMKRVDGSGAIDCTVDRSTLWHALTPQMFRFGLLRECLARAAEAGWTLTDEASAIEAAGMHPRVVEGRADNLKITRPEDMLYAQWLLSQRT